MKTPSALVLAIGMSLWVMTGCSKPPQTGRGFYLPKGDPVKGQAAFVDLKCFRCHRVDGVTLPEPTEKTVVQLGGKVHHLRSFGGLVTSVIHPSHRFSEQYDRKSGETESPMPQVNDRMTVQQMVDIVTFLQPRY